MTNPCKEIPLPTAVRTQAQDREKDLLAEIGRLSLQLRAVEFQAHTLQAQLSDLEADGTIDQMGRKLPLPGHHNDCPHGQNGWAVCTCDPHLGLKAGDRVRFEIEGVIKERWASGFKDLDGNDLEPVQYVIQVLAARSYYVTTLDETLVALLNVTGNQIIKVIGKEE